MNALKALAVTAVAALGALFAVGSALAALFEIQGFGALQDSGPRPAYLVALALGFVASLAAPAACWWLLYRSSWGRRGPGSA